MMPKGKSAFIKDWGVIRFLHTYLMLKLNRLFGFRISIVKAQEISKSHIEQFEQDGIRYRPLTPEDFGNQSLNRELDISHSFLNKAFSQGDQCVGALVEDQVVGYLWRTTQAVELSHPLYMEFGDKLYYRYKEFVKPEYRGRGIINQIKKLAESKQIAEGRRYAFGCIETHNYPSLIASKKHGDRTLGYSAFIYNRFFFINWSSNRAKQFAIKVIAKR